MAAAEPVLATVTDTVDTLAHDVVGAAAPVIAAAEPVLATATDAVDTLAHDVAGTAAPVVAAAEPVLTTETDTVDTLTHDVAGAAAPVSGGELVLDCGRRGARWPMTWRARSRGGAAGSRCSRP